MSQAGVERCIGRLLTDEAARRRFREAPDSTLLEIAERAGAPLTRDERAALAATSADDWEALAERIDPRLQRLTGGAGWRPPLFPALLLAACVGMAAPAGAQPPSPLVSRPEVPAEAQPEAPTALSLADARARALEHVPEIAVQRTRAAQAATQVDGAAAAWDPVVRLEAQARSRTDPLNTLFSGAPEGALGPRTTGVSTVGTWSRLFTSGATVTARASLAYERTDSLLALLTPAYQGSLGIEARQPLARGRRIDVARHRLRLTQLDVSRSRLDVERQVIETVAAVEQAYWALVAARQREATHERALALARAQRGDVEVRIEAGTAAEADLATSDAAIAERDTARIAAREQAQQAELALRGLLASDARDAMWTRPVVLADEEPPPRPAALPPATTLVETALSHRVELDDLALLDEGAALDEELATDRLRPQVDLVGSYALRGLAGTRNPDARLPFATIPIVVDEDLQGAWGQSLRTALGHRFADVGIGVQVSLPLGQREARAARTRAALARDRIAARRMALEVRIAREVRQAVAAMEAARERRLAAATAREAAARQLEAEQVRDAAGLSTDFLRLTRQVDLARAELAAIAAAADEAAAAMALDRATGQVLERRDIRWEDVP